MLFRSFLQDRRAGVAPMFALAILPVVGLVGMAVDYSRGNSLKVAIQSALDATALYLAKSAPALSQQSTLEDDKLQKAADAHFKALINRPDAKIDPIKATYSTDTGTQLVLTASGSVDLTFGGVFRLLDPSFTKLNVGTSSTIKWGNQRLRVALVLDNTGSMLEYDKIGALKKATNDLLKQLKDAATKPEDVYISIIPFVKDVNADKNNYTANWIDWTEWEAEPPILDTANGGSKPSNWYSITSGSSCPFGNSSHGFRCTDGPATSGASRTSTIPSTGNYKGLICPGLDNGNEKPLKANDYYNGCYNSWTNCVGSTCACTTSNTSICECTGSGASKACTAKAGYYEHTWRPSASNTYTPALVLDAGVPHATPGRNTWNGCVVDRGDKSAPNSGNYDTNVVAPTTGTTATLFAAEQYASCPQAILPLGSPLNSADWTKMTNLVNDMVAAGNTNQAIGLMHGWMSLVGGGPYPAPPAKDATYAYNEVIILLTDGLNTQNRWYTSQSSINAREQMTCNNINAANITLYAIQVNTGGDPTSTLLQKCAGSPGKYPDSDKFFTVTSSSGIGTVFNLIGTQLSKLRIAK